MRPSTPVASRPIHAAFFRAGLIATLTLGSTFGAYNLLAIHDALGPIPPAHNWVHGTFQVWGFVLFFIMGAAYRVVPEITGAELAWPRVARVTLWLGAAALFFLGWGRLGRLVPAPGPAFALGAATELATIAAFAGVVLATLARGRGTGGLGRFVATGTGWWLLSAMLMSYAAARGLARNDAGEAAAFNDAEYAAALYGGALIWLQALLLRAWPAARQRSPRRLVGAAFWAGQLGAALAVFGEIARGRAGEIGRDVALVASAIAVGLFVLGLRPFTRRPAAERAQRTTLFIVRLAFVSSALFVALACSYALLDLQSGAAPRLLFDGARHAFTLGFVALVLFAMPGAAPSFDAEPIVWPRLREIGASLMVLGVMLRQAQVAAALLRDSSFLRVSAISGIVAAIGVVMVSVSVFARERRPQGHARTAPSVRGGLPPFLEEPVSITIDR